MALLKQKINDLILKWEVDNSYRSDINTEDPYYKSIVEMGPLAVPYLLTRLGDSWIILAALHEITGENPIDKEIAGMFKAMNDTWKKWGQEKGLLKD